MSANGPEAIGAVETERDEAREQAERLAQGLENAIGSTLHPNHYPRRILATYRKSQLDQLTQEAQADGFYEDRESQGEKE